MKDTLALSIEAMHCGACVRRVTGALEGLHGMQLGRVEVGSAQLAYDPEEATPEEIAAAVSRIGFQASVAK